MVIVSLHIPSQLAEKLDKIVRQGGYTSKSEAIRDTIRLLLREYEKNVALLHEEEIIEEVAR